MSAHKLDLSAPLWQVCRAPTALLANGAFPTHAVPLAALQTTIRVVCCDGATAKLVATGYEPAAIVGDLDSLPDELRVRYADRLHRDPSQDDNDLSKAFRFCLGQGWRELVILGATGLREDHTLGNLSLLADFAAQAEVALLTDSGVFRALHASATLASFAGQAVSLFAFDPRTSITARGLRYPVERLRLTRWWQATLNEALGVQIEVAPEDGPVLVFQAYRN